jgi:hypothetical protein
MPYRDPMIKEYLGVNDSLLESEPKCLDAASVRSLGAVQLAEAAESRLESLAQRALADDEAREYDRFIELGDIIATLRLKAERQMQVERGSGERGIAPSIRCLMATRFIFRSPISCAFLTAPVRPASAGSFPDFHRTHHDRHWHRRRGWSRKAEWAMVLA